MASEDVIDLGSSEDEAEPAAKKIKPTPNAMVHIPNKIPSVTKPVNIISLKNNPVAKLTGKGITVTKVSPNANKNFTNIKNKPKGRNGMPMNKQNPIGLMKRINTSQIVINRVPSASASKYLNTPIKVLPPPNIKVPSQSIKITPNIKGPSQGIKIPPNITIKRTADGKSFPSSRLGTNITPIIHNPKNIIRVSKPPQIKTRKKKVVKEVMTVELDDDEETATSTSNPQWYIRPEDHSVKKTEEPNMQKENNQEPKNNQMIEITIEDSPVKQLTNMKTDLAITIDDSPVKPHTPRKQNIHVGSDKESKCSKPLEKQSKKKLYYPNNTVEIEIDGEAVTTDSEKVKKNQELENVIEIEESPYKMDTHQPDTPKKMLQTKPLLLDDIKTLNDDQNEFHPVYKNFIDLCFKLENSDDMKKIVEKKIKAYYRQVPIEYTNSESFIDMVSCKITCMKASPDKMYLYIKDIVDELNLQRKTVKAQVTEADEKNEVVQNYLYGEDSEFDSKRQRQIRKLEKTLKKLHRAVQKLEEQEVDFDDDEDSVYLLTERYKERMVKVHAKFCQLTNTKMPSEPRIQIDARPGQPSGPAKKLEKWINKKVPIGSPLPFPDFHDVIRCVREANEEDKLGWNEVDIMEEARDLFTRCGKKLQRRRQENEWRSAASRISVDIDPAENDVDLKTRLEQNRQVAAKKESEVFNKYAIRQSQLNLEAEEIGDKEAEESPVESEEEEQCEENDSLENKEKRKDRLRRLLQQKSKLNQPENNSDSKKGSEQSDNDVEMTQIESQDDKDPPQTAEKVKEHVETMDVDNVTKDNSAPSASSSKNLDINEDNENRIDSDIDELHLLQKLHSGNEISSTIESSDSESPINISDTMDSSSDIENKHNSCSEVISIENSSYSESECIDQNPGEAIVLAPKGDAELVIELSGEVECSKEGVKKHQVHSNNEEYCEPVEDILLASSDDEGSAGTESSQANKDYVNTKDDSLSIGSTTVEGADQNNDVASANEDSQDKPDKTDSNGKINETSLPKTNVETHEVKTGTNEIISKQVESLKESEFNENNSVVDSTAGILIDSVVIEKDAEKNAMVESSAGTLKDLVVVEKDVEKESKKPSADESINSTGKESALDQETSEINVDFECAKSPVAIILSNETEVH